MSGPISDKAFVLAAGFGKRLRPFTDSVPKPMVEVAGRTLLDRTFHHLEAAGVKEVVVNTHYLAPVLSERLKNRHSPRIHTLYEPELLDTGGGIRNGLEYFGDTPFFVLSGDGLWTDGPGAMALERLKQAWDPDKMDILMLLQPVKTMVLTEGAGDYDLDHTGRSVRSKDKTGAYMFTSIRINHPRIFAETSAGPFSYLQLMDKAQEQGRLYGLVHDGDWHHISSPPDLLAVRAAFETIPEKAS